MASSAMEEEIEISHELVPCYICGRTFLPCPLKKHITVCERNATRKRKIFDSLKQRVDGTDLAPFHQATFLKKPTTNENPAQITAPAEIGSNTQRSQSKWKEKHEEFVQTIRAAKGEKVMGPRRSISAVGTMGVTERCPYCERQFGPKSYDRHVDWCKEHKNRGVMKSPANVIQAKERLEARTKYRVPPLNKSKRSITRDKYSTSLSRTESVVSVRSAGSSSVERSSPSVRRSKAMVATHHQHHSAPEPIIKSTTKVTVEKSKSPHTKSRPSAPKVNSPHVNASVDGMVVSHVNISLNEPTKLTSWKHIDEAQRANQLILNSNEVSLAVNTDNSVVQMTDNGQLSISPLITTQDSQDIDSRDNNMELVTMIKEPSNGCSSSGGNNNNYDMDSLYNEPETKRFMLNKAYSNLELNSNSTDFKTTHHLHHSMTNMEKDSLESVNCQEKDFDFLHSLKFKSNTSEMFSAELKTKYTSTPLQDKCDTGSFTMRCEQLNFKDLFVVDETMLLHVNDAVVISVHDRTATIEDVSECFTDVTPPQEIIQYDEQQHVLEAIDLPEMSEQKQFDDDEKFLEQLAEENGGAAAVVVSDKIIDRPDYIDGKRPCNIADLERFLGSQPDERQLEIEIIATEVCANDKQTGPCLNLYQTHSKEIIIEGQTCLETLNNLLSRNEVRSVNIIIVNEDLCNEPNDGELAADRSAIKERNLPFKKRMSPRQCLQKKEPAVMEQLQSLHLPIVDDCSQRLTTDDFWMNTNELVSPLRIQKIELHEREFDRPAANRTVTFAKLPSLFNTPRDSEECDTARTNRDYPRQCKLPIFSTPRYYSSTTPDEEYNPFVVAEKQLMELLECDDFKPYNTASPPKNQSSKCTPPKTTTTTAQNKYSAKTPSAKRSSIIDPPNDFQDKMLLLQDNFELIENFINDNYVSSNDTIVSQKSKVNNHADSNSNKTTDALGLHCILQYGGRKYSDDTNSIDPRLINETDNLTIPDKLPVDNYCSPTSSDHYSAPQYDTKISVYESAKNDNGQTLDDHDDIIDFDEFISSFDDDESFPTLKSFLQSTKSDKSERKTVQKSTLSLNSSYGKHANGPDIKKPITPLKRSVSLSNPVVKARSMKSKQDIQEYLHATDTKAAKRSERREKANAKRNETEPLFPPDHAMYEQYKKYKDLYRQEKNEFIADEKKTAATVTRGEGDYDEISSNEDVQLARKSQAVKVSGDSAYGSLNRQAPKIQPRAASSNRHGLRSSVERSPSSTGSETSVTVPTAAKTKSRIPKFCHECGTKYPVDVAKFCVECGVKRLVL